jgi:peptide chain release factor 2
MLEEIKSRIIELEKHLEQLRGYLDIDNKEKQAEELSLKMAEQGFWDDQAESAKVVKQLKSLKSALEPWQQANKKLEDIKGLVGILKEEDKDMLAELLNNTACCAADLERLEFKTILGGQFDKNNAIISINAGAGGTESCDWVSMLFRMYNRWAERHGYAIKVTDILLGEEAGIKNVTAFVEGEFAYGYLKAERGVHRLVRISPFDANKRRHTSFASFDAIPEVEDDIDLKLEDKDLRVDVFRSSGAGGQSVNTTDSAVRITHIPTGIVVQCQNERSQYQNKQTAMKILKSRIYEFERKKQEEELARQYDTSKKKIEWGSQIRSYVMHPYSMVKDHRTDKETGDVASFMDGDIDGFIEAYLKSQVENRK